MARTPKIAFTTLSEPREGTAVVVMGESDPPRTLAAAVGRAIDVARFKGKALQVMEVLAPADTGLDRILVAGVGKLQELDERAWLKLGGAVMGRLKEAKAAAATVVLDLPDLSPDCIAEFALGLRLRAYDFDRYKTKRADEPAPELDVIVSVVDPAAAERAFDRRAALAAGVELARDLVNEPPNVLGPAEFARIAEGLADDGVAVEILSDVDMKSMGMGAFLGVARGSVRPPLLAVLRWNGGTPGAPPLAFVGKGVVFDSGGISIKPGSGMEDMKGDMGGAAAVLGLMKALAGRKAAVNAVGLLALVENMPDGDAQRPGDIVTSASGQTIEIINTDAEGRLILADALWYVQEGDKPALIVDLATLTGACVVALGAHYAGLFSTSNELAERLAGAGEATGERVWRLPLGPEYDKMIDSRFADMKNTGGRHAGAITAAQFLKRFVGETPWAHLDIAGTALASPDTEINRSWGSGFGVRLLDRFVSDHYEG